MKFGLLFCALCLWGQAAGQGAEVLRIVQSLSRDLQESASQPDSWLTRYQQIANVIKSNSDLGAELQEISDVAMPVIWNTFMAVTMGTTLLKIGKGGTASPYSPPPYPLPPPQPEYLFIFPSNLTCDDMFIVQATVIPKTEANVGFRVHFAPPDGEPLDFEKGDLLFSFHLRWHFDYGPSKEIAFNDRYNGEWSRPEVTVGGNLWPNVTAGERFIVSTEKNGPCFTTIVILGDDMHLAVPTVMNPLVFCPKVPVTGDPRKLWLTVNEDKRGANEVIVQWITWFPTD